MKKMDCIFKRIYFTRNLESISEQRDKQHNRYLAIDEINPSCQWVFDGEGIPTIKWDGTAVLIHKNGQIATAQNDDGVFEYLGHVLQAYQRYASTESLTKDVMDSKGWLLADVRKDNGRHIYWIPVKDKWILEAFQNYFNREAMSGNLIFEGTYEAIGPKINNNRYKADRHTLIRHGWGNGCFDSMTLSYTGIKEFLRTFKLQIPEIYNDSVFHEGIVFHHPDGRMAKIRRSDFEFS